MKALVTGASSGIGREMANLLAQNGYDLILVSRNRDELFKLKTELPVKSEIYPMDLSEPRSCYELYELVKGDNIEVLINNAGYGIFGNFTETNLENELNMIDLNIKAVHILTKLFLKDFEKRKRGYILNVASSAGLLPAGPLLSSYYASKSYIVNLTRAIQKELRIQKSPVKISVLCPGPVDTGFNRRAGVSFAMKGLKSSYVAEYALNELFSGKKVIIPGFKMRLMTKFSRLLPTSILIDICYRFQKSKDR